MSPRLKRHATGCRWAGAVIYWTWLDSGFELMLLAELTRYHIPSSLIDGWRKRQGDMLLPLQSEALRQGLLSDESEARSQSLLISAPTSTGKTFCGELALAGAVALRRKGVLLVPLKSIAEEKFAEFEPLYRHLNLKCIIATADHPEYSRALARGSFDIAICVYEKLNHALLANVDLLGRIGALVIDEAQLLTDSERGIALESILLKLTGYRQASSLGNRTTQLAPRLIALTASLASDSALAKRLGARLIRETRRPVELRQGVLFERTYRYFNRDTGEIGSEECDTQRSPRNTSAVDYLESAAPITVALLEQLRVDNGPTLVFLSDRWRVVGAALTLASCGRWPRAERPLADLTGEEPSSVVRSLCQALTCGVAFHSADLTAFQRRVIERGFRAGEIRVIFCTTTLGLGVNLPAETVYIEPFKYISSVVESGEGRRKSGAAGLAPLPRADFENIAGRAGRYGCQIDNGPNQKSSPNLARAVLLAQTEFERDILWGNYIEPSHHPEAKLSLIVDSGQSNDTLAALALELIVCGLAPNVQRLSGAFATLRETSGSTQQRDGDALSNCVASLVGAVKRLRELGLINPAANNSDLGNEDRTSGSTLLATALGRVAGVSGLSLASVTHFVSALQRIQPTAAHEWLALALSAPDFVATGAVLRPVAAGVVARQLFTALPDSADKLLTCLSGGCPVSSPVSVSGASRLRAPQLVMRIRAFLALHSWRSGERAQFLETSCQMSVAQVLRLAENARWLLQGLIDIALVVGSLGGESSTASQLTVLLNSMRYGLPERALELAELLSKKTDGSCYPLTDLFNRAELIEFERSDCRTATDVLALLASSSAKNFSDISINPNAAFKVKECRLRERLTALGQAPASAPTASGITSISPRKNNITHSNKKERSMREQTMTQQIGAGQPLQPSLARSASKTVAGVSPGLASVPCSLQIDGASRGERFLLRVDGLPVSLTGKSFKYLVKLVCARLGRSGQSDGWIYKDDIEVGFNQARYLYRMRREIAAQLPGYRWSVYENNRLGYYRLALDPAALDVNRKTLASSPDYEVAQAAAALPASPLTIASGATLARGEQEVSTGSRRLG